MGHQRSDVIEDWCCHFSTRGLAQGELSVDVVPCRTAPSRQASLNLDSDDEEMMPSFELPSDLQEYQGDPQDRKGMLGFRQIQQACCFSVRIRFLPRQSANSPQWMWIERSGTRPTLPDVRRS